MRIFTAGSPGQRLLLDPVGELGDLVVNRPALGHQGADFLVRVHDRGVVAAAELLADLRQGQVDPYRDRWATFTSSLCANRVPDF
jgi:hypothetical protein